MTHDYIYWGSTILLSLLYLSSATIYVVKREWVGQALSDLGYPAYLRPLLAAVKVLAVAIILSRPQAFLSDLAYAGIFYHLLLSAVAHIGVRKPREALPALVGLMLLVASFATQNTVREFPSPYAPALAEHKTLPNQGESA